MTIANSSCAEGHPPDASSSQGKLVAGLGSGWNGWGRGGTREFLGGEEEWEREGVDLGGIGVCQVPVHVFSYSPQTCTSKI